jgi:hypothetical protein
MMVLRLSYLDGVSKVYLHFQQLAIENNLDLSWQEKVAVSNHWDFPLA